jgi:hypothetical protein
MKSLNKIKEYQQIVNPQINFLPLKFILHLLIIFLISWGCASRNFKSNPINIEKFQKLPDKNFQEELKLLCFNGTGYGKILFEGEKESFSIETQWNHLSNENWKVVFLFPFRGEELLEFDWSSPLEINSTPKGDFYHHLINFLISENKKFSSQTIHKSMENFFQHLKLFFQFLSKSLFKKNPLNPEISCNLEDIESDILEGECKFNKFHYDWIINGKENNLTLTDQKSNIGNDPNKFLKIIASERIIHKMENKSYYQKLNFTFSSPLLIKPMEFEFFIDECFD